MVQFHYVFDTPLIIPVTQHKLEQQMSDSYKSRFCPIYSNAIKQSLYLAPESDIEMMWHGGDSVTVKYSAEWDEAYNRAKSKWLRRGLSMGMQNPVEHRYRVSKPLGSPDGGTMQHAGGVTVNFFTGTIITTSTGLKTLVGPAINRFDFGWTVQHGWYDTDVYHGEFSLNFQVMAQNVPIVIKRHQPIASLLFVHDQQQFHSGGFSISSPGTLLNDAALKQSDEFYFRKSEKGLTYRENISPKV